MPLAAAFAQAPDAGTELVLHIDARTSCRILTEIVFTAGQHGHSVSYVVVRRPDHRDGAVRLELPKMAFRPPTDAGCSYPDVVDPTVIVVGTGYAVKAFGASVGPGCETFGIGGVTIPRRDDTDALTACLVKLRSKGKCKEPEREIMITANPDQDLQTLVRTWEAVRTDPSGNALFPDVRLTILK